LVKAARAVRAMGVLPLACVSCENIARANESKAHLCNGYKKKKNALARIIHQYCVM